MQRITEILAARQRFFRILHLLTAQDRDDGKRGACPTIGEVVFFRVMAHPPRIPVWLPHDCAVVYFVTICVKGRKRILANAAGLEALEHAVAKLAGWWVYAAILMPDHLHALAAPHDREQAIGNLSGAIKRWMRRELNAEWEWQTGCFDRLLRSEESVGSKWEYMRENPVRAGLVEEWRLWPYSIGFRPPTESRRL